MNRFLSAARGFCLRAGQQSEERDSGFLQHWPVLVLSMAAGASAALALGQDCSWDVLNYHFYSGFAFLHKPLNFDFAPAQVQSFFSPLMHVFSYLALAHLPSRLVTALLGAVQGLNFYLVFQISQILFRDWAHRFWLSLINAAAGCYGAIFILELGTTFGDTLISLLILSGLLLILRYLKGSAPARRPRDLPLGVAGAILGVAFGLKLTVGLYVTGVVAALSAILLLGGCRLRALLIFLCCLGAGFAGTYGFWGYSLYHEYQNPVFPHMNSLFQSPYYEPKNLADARFFPRTWTQRYFYPFFFAGKNGLVSEIPFRDVRLALCYGALVSLMAARLLNLFRRSRKRANRPVCGPRCRDLAFLAVFFAVSYAVWQYQFSVYRYLIVLELLAPAFLALVLAYFVDNKPRVFACSLLLNAIICASTSPADFGRQAFDDEFLKVEIPAIGELQRSVVLMGGPEATSYIIPHFPAGTRFVRISSNFLYPGLNARLDQKIRGLLAQYDGDHTFIYLFNDQEMARMRREAGYYGVIVDEGSCQAILSRAAEGGRLCRSGTGSSRHTDIPAPESSNQPLFEDLGSVRLDASPKAAGNGDRIRFHLLGLNLQSIDVWYTINGKPQLPQRRWHLDENHCIQFPVSATVPRGLYHFVGVRDPADPKADRWINIDARVLIR